MQEFPVLYDKKRGTKIITVHGRCDWKSIRIGKNNKEECHFYKTVKEQVGHKNALFSLNPANICWSSRRLEDVFKTYLEDVFNTSSA